MVWSQRCLFPTLNTFKKFSEFWLKRQSEYKDSLFIYWYLCIQLEIVRTVRVEIKLFIAYFTDSLLKNWEQIIRKG